MLLVPSAFMVPTGKVSSFLQWRVSGGTPFPHAVCLGPKRKKSDLALPCLRACLLWTCDQAHWHLLLRCRAVETQCFVVAAAQVGQHNEKRASFGHTLVVDPWGTVLLDMGVCGDAQHSVEEMQESVKSSGQPVQFVVEGQEDGYVDGISQPQPCVHVPSQGPP